MPPSFTHPTVGVAAAILCAAAWSQPAPDGRPAAVIPLDSEPAAKLVVYPPLAGPLARGVVIVQYRTENLRVIPVFGMGAVEVSPRVGHLHVTVDDRPGTWAHTSGGWLDAWPAQDADRTRRPESQDHCKPDDQRNRPGAQVVRLP
jgi:hypothetical protein